jgi:hypothetical protein
MLSMQYRVPVMLAAIAIAPAAQASLSIHMSPEDLAQRSEVIVEATVVRSASGYDPLTAALATYVTLDVETVHRGPSDCERLVIREPGGRYGGLVHELDAVPTYEAAEKVFLFLEPSRDGSLRTTGMFFGKFRLDYEGERTPLNAARDLEGKGLILGSAGERLERFPVGDLIAVAATTPLRAIHAGPRGASFLRQPPEYSRLLWDGASEVADGIDSEGEGSGEPRDLSFTSGGGQPTAQSDFVPMSSSHPTRWAQTDSGTAISINIDRDNDPLGDGAAAVAEIQRAMAAWTDVPEARITLATGSDNYDYTGRYSQSPTALYSGINVILFDDPYNDISDPYGCAGVLAIGGYWRSSSTGPPVNNVIFHPALQLYVIFANDLECFLGNPDNLAEIAAHELGHGLGFGHSSAADAIMRSYAYGLRGPRLGDDDRDAAHCHYPHTLTLTSPNGGESWEAGTVETVEWLVTPEDGPSPGHVTLEYSMNGGEDWTTIAEDEFNDGHYEWMLPSVSGDDVRLRVIRHNRGGSVPPEYPSACSRDASDSSFIISAPAVIAGSIPAGGAGAGLVIGKAPPGLLRLSWSPSCSGDVDGHAIYEGSMAALRDGVWDHAPATCSAGVDLVEYLDAGGGNRYFLVAPLAASFEGSIGNSSGGEPRPAAAAACGVREESSACY